MLIQTEAAGSWKNLTTVSVVSARSLSLLLILSSLFFLTANFVLLFFRNIHWDEFLFLSRIYRYYDGTLSNPFQTFYVHLFSWMPTVVGNNEINQILVGRIICFLFFLGTIYLSYQIARRFLSPLGALFVLLCYSAFYEVLEHVGSFRIESLSTFLFLLVLNDLLKGGSEYLRTRFSCYGLVMAISMLFSVKAIFHILLLILLILRDVNRRPLRQQLSSLIYFGISGTFCFTLLLLLHRVTLAAMPMANLPPWFTLKIATLFEVGGQAEVFLESVYRSPVQWLLIFFGLLFVSRQLTSEVRQQAAMPTIQVVLFFSFLLFLPLLFFRNAWGYFYPFILSPAILLCGVLASNWERRRQEERGGRSVALLGFCLIVLAIDLSGLQHVKRRTFDGITPQREVIAMVHRIFPQKVPYLDRSAMISTFPRVGPMISTLVLKEYRRVGMPIMKPLLVEQQPVFVLANSPTLQVFSTPTFSDRIRWTPLLEEDQKVLRENFIHHWGPIYVAGKEFLALDKSAFVSFEILIPGEYTVESSAAVMIDGLAIEPYSVIELSGGEHSIVTAQIARLRWGRELFQPQQSAPAMPLYHGY